MPGTARGSLVVTGWRETATALQGFGVDTEDIEDAWSAVASMGARTASSLAPRGPTGRLKGDVRGDRAKNKAIISVGSSRVPYAGPLNYGWPRRDIRPNYFLQRTDRALAPFALRRLQTGLQRAAQRRGLS